MDMYTLRQYNLAWQGYYVAAQYARIILEIPHTRVVVNFPDALTKDMDPTATLAKSLQSSPVDEHQKILQMRQRHRNSKQGELRVL